MAMGSLASAENTTSQDNTSIASPSSTMSNVQVNPVGDVAESSFGGGVRCSEPTLNTGITQTRTGFGDDMTTGYVNLAIPWGPGFEIDLCEDAARTQNDINMWKLIDAQEQALRREEMHQAQMEKVWLEVAEKEASNVRLCMELHKYVSANPNTEISGFCGKFAPITQDHHKDAPPINTALIPDTHKRISPNKQDRP